MHPAIHLTFLRQGKVRDVYSVDDRHLLIVASDRISAFDHILPNTIPGKGRVLTQLSNFWFARSRKPPVPTLPPEVVRKTSQKCEEALKRFTENPGEEIIR